MDNAKQIEEYANKLREAVAVINDALTWLDGQLIRSPLSDVAATVNEVAGGLATQRAEGNSAPSTQPEPEPPLTLEAVRAVLAEKARAGHTAEVRALLQKHGADRLSAIDPAEYKALLADAEALPDAS